MARNVLSDIMSFAADGICVSLHKANVDCWESKYLICGMEHTDFEKQHVNFVDKYQI